MGRQNKGSLLRVDFSASRMRIIAQAVSGSCDFYDLCINVTEIVATCACFSRCPFHLLITYL